VPIYLKLVLKEKKKMAGGKKVTRSWLIDDTRSAKSTGDASTSKKSPKKGTKSAIRAVESRKVGRK
jgi:hypothetical protein